MCTSYCGVVSIYTLPMEMANENKVYTDKLMDKPTKTQLPWVDKQMSFLQKVKPHNLKTDPPYLLLVRQKSSMSTTVTEMEKMHSKGKRCAVVTGGNKGIGLEICRLLASKGIYVILTARDEKRGTEAVENLKESGLTDVVFHQLDITDSTGITSLAEFVRHNFKKLDILVNNAGDGGVLIDGEAFRSLPHGFGDVRDEDPGILKGIMEQTTEKSENCLKTNYYGTKAVTEALLPLLHLSNSANIVNVTSIYGKLMFIPNEKVKDELNNVESLTEESIDKILQAYMKDFNDGKWKANGWPITLSAYKMSKAAANAYTRLLARQFPNMRINAVHPGYVKTDITCNTGIFTAEEGAEGPVKLALFVEGDPSGHYFDRLEMSVF